MKKLLIIIFTFPPQLIFSLDVLVTDLHLDFYNHSSHVHDNIDDNKPHSHSHKHSEDEEEHEHHHDHLGFQLVETHKFLETKTILVSERSFYKLSNNYPNIFNRLASFVRNIYRPPIS